MYTRNFRRFETDGQLLKMQKERERELLKDLTFDSLSDEKDNELEAGYSVVTAPAPPAEVPAVAKPAGGLLGNLFGGILGNWSFDDLILIGLTLYLLTDNNEGNDLLVILLVLLLT